MTAFGSVLPQDDEFDPAVARISIQAGAAPKVRSEAVVTESALGYLRGLPHSYARKVHGGAMGNNGEPDIDACIEGRSVKLEAKRVGNKPTHPQVTAMLRWARVGALVGWFRTNEEIAQILDHLHDPGFQPDIRYPGCRCPRHVTDAS